MPEEPAAVAIITRTNNRPLFLERAMQSVLRQTLQDWTHVIVNDGGDPGPVDILARAYADAYAGRLQVVHHPRPLGMQEASNAGVRASSSKYLTIHDDDDSWDPEFLTATVGYLEEQEPDSLVRGVVCQTTQVLEEVSPGGDWIELERKPYHPFAFVNLEDMCRRNLFAPIAFLYRREVHETVGFFRQEFDVLGDHDFNLRFLLHFEIGVLNRFLAFYHWRHGSYGNTVTRARNVHRTMLSRLKNAYARQARLGGPSVDLSSIEFPGPDGAEPAPLIFRDGESPEPLPMPNLDTSGGILSLDIFDTVLLRRCHRPVDVFLWLERLATEQLNLPAMPYALARRSAERLARQRAGNGDAEAEVGLEDIYTVLAELCGLAEPAKKALLELEIELEDQVLYADPRWLQLYKEQQTLGTRIVFLSDMYHSSATLARWLQARGFSEPEVYVSWELGASKHLGTLQPVVAARLGVEPARLLHVGDNRHSDYFRSLQAGFRAVHWTPAYFPSPWYAETRQQVHIQGDLLSSRIMGEVQRINIVATESEIDLLERLGREVAGPLYLAYTRWFLQQARADGIRRLILLGRDGYYWEKTLKLLPAEEVAGIEFVYLPSSRKVFNFASFETVDTAALEFLLTPNPALRVRDFLDRACLDSDQHLETIRQAGFPDPEAVLTNESGGRFLDPVSRERLIVLFQLLKPQLEQLFAADRLGVLKSLEAAGYHPEDSAFVDIGWTGSSIRPMQRLFGSKHPVRAYFFGSWQEAQPVARIARIRSFFLHLGQPLDRFQLLRESVNLLESLHAAPHPPLIAYQTVDDLPVGRHAPQLLGGFNSSQQAQIWAGAEGFLRSIIAGGLPPAGPADGICYTTLILQRFLREPTPAEVKAWGGLQHSDGFGIEVYKPLVDAQSVHLEGEPLLQAFHASSWKRGFLTALTPDKRQFVIERVFPKIPRTMEELRAAYEFKCRQTDEFWSEKERYKWEAGHYRKEIDRLSGVIAEAQQTLTQKTQDTERALIQIERQQQEIRLLEGQAQAHREHLETLQNEIKDDAGLIQTLRAERDAVQTALEEQRLLRREAEQAQQRTGQDLQTARQQGILLEQKLAQAEQEARQQVGSLQQQLTRLRAILKDRPALLRILWSGRVVGDDADQP